MRRFLFFVSLFSIVSSFVSRVSPPPLGRMEQNRVHNPDRRENPRHKIREKRKWRKGKRDEINYTDTYGHPPFNCMHPQTQTTIFKQTNKQKRKKEHINTAEQIEVNHMVVGVHVCLADRGKERTRTQRRRRRRRKRERGRKGDVSSIMFHDGEWKGSRCCNIVVYYIFTTSCIFLLFPLLLLLLLLLPPLLLLPRVLSIIIITTITTASPSGVLIVVVLLVLLTTRVRVMLRGCNDRE